MTKKELLATFPGSTLYGISNADGKTPWAQAYGKGRKKGKIAGNHGGDTYEATWFVQDDLWCEESENYSSCWQVVQTGDKEFQVYKDGQPMKNRWKMK
ncbi:hypothetical protein HW561_01950 [Rhodobacteraceae bacterium B1Z28]|uniref:MORN repeat protein n=1 Tax=Ruegeria haliotis TaxID=2747601 RepID=A0ABX2PKD4_9RHOB|nr:hypothetical protein [Ruegeria haliotis]NVO54551.1 hypothetical protein [Ruegeria haliotis]